MAQRIYLVGTHGLQPMDESPYESEDRLQHLLAEYPDLLAGDQIDRVAPRRWLLVRREMPVADQDTAAGRWSLDHLFLDQDGIPTLVETKRSSDTRLRREVIGQMLDYAANAVLYWPVEIIRQQFVHHCEELGQDANRVIADFLSDDAEVLGGSVPTAERFWAQVKTNLEAERIRMVFVADEIPHEVRRIVEFLNAQMDPAEVLAVEVRQYVGAGIQALVPRVVGQTAQAEQRKGSTRPVERQWDEPRFLQALAERFGEAEVEVARSILVWVRPLVSRIDWGRGSRSGSCSPVLNRGGRDYCLFVLWTYATVELQFQYLVGQPPFNDPANREELRRRLNAIEGLNLPEDAITRRPGIPLAMLRDAGAMATFQGSMEWAFALLRSCH